MKKLTPRFASVHDELIFEVREEELDETILVVKKTMEDAAHLGVPILVDIGVGDNWDQALGLLLRLSVLSLNTVLIKKLNNKLAPTEPLFAS